MKYFELKRRKERNHYPYEAAVKMLIGDTDTIATDRAGTSYSIGGGLK